jgi:predicted O-linked N-acetylglucosamine transferase (SPINDLY family)
MKSTQLKQQKAQVANLLQKGFALHQQNRFQEAKVIYQQILVKEPYCFDALQLLGLLFAQTNQFSKAANFLSKALQVKPNHIDCVTNYGNVLQELKRFDEAITFYDEVLLIKQDSEIYFNRAKALKELKRFDESIASYDLAIRISPDAEIYYSRGSVLQEIKRFKEAIASYDNAISIKTDYPEAHFSRGNALLELKCYDHAIESYNQVIRIKPDYAEAYNNLGFVLLELKRFDEALVSYDRAISIKLDFAEAYYNRGIALKELKRFGDAIASYNHAIRIKPNYAEAHHNQGLVFQKILRHDESIASFENALKIKPDFEFTLGFLQHAKMFTCNWENFDNLKKLILQKTNAKEKVSDPFTLIAITDTISTQRTCSEIWIKEKFPPNNNLGPIPKKSVNKKIRLGYFSGDFHNHPTSFLTVELFETHYKDQFEIIAFSFGPDQKVQIRNRLVTAFDQFIDVRNKTDQEVALLSRSLGIDIAIDLGGFTGDCRTGIFAYQAAPIQINYLVYPGTLGAEYIDYIIGDKTLIPDKSQQFYSEKVIYLPNSYQVNDRKKIISDKQFSRTELGLPEDIFVFCCFNNNYKILPETFDGWMRILTAVEGSVLWLFQDNDWVTNNLKREAQKRGVSESRLFFAKRLPLDEHLARHRNADLFLDTFPYNAHTTASDALWTGLPLLTLMGESFASRVAASLLTAIDLPELITSSQEHYEALAIELATNPIKLKAIKAKLETNRLTKPLFDTPLFTKHLEDAYTKIYKRYQADLPPEHIYIVDETLAH